MSCCASQASGRSSAASSTPRLMSWHRAASRGGFCDRTRRRSSPVSRSVAERFENILTAIDRCLAYRPHRSSADQKLAAMAYDAVLWNLVIHEIFPDRPERDRGHRRQPAAPPRRFAQDQAVTRSNNVSSSSRFAAAGPGPSRQVDSRVAMEGISRGLDAFAITGGEKVEEESADGRDDGGCRSHRRVRGSCRTGPGTGVLARRQPRAGGNTT